MRFRKTQVFEQMILNKFQQQKFETQVRNKKIKEIII